MFYIFELACFRNAESRFNRDSSYDSIVVYRAAYIP